MNGKWKRKGDGWSWESGELEEMLCRAVEKGKEQRGEYDRKT